MKIKPLTLPERKSIEMHVKSKVSLSQIAKLIDRSKNCVVSEVRVNGGREVYSADSAHARSVDVNHMKYMNMVKRNGFSGGGYKTIKSRLETIEMQIEILHETLKGLLNGKN